ncbi:MAG: site-specific integrase [Bacteroidetes bacterium]|nr:site-specific integrase [Bacteroidota bacterium]
MYERAAAEKQDLDELVINKQLEKVITYVDDVILSFDSEKEISPGTRNSYINDLLNFLRWCSNRYCRGKYNSVIEDRLDSYRIKATTFQNNIKSLNENEESLLREFIFPSSDKNPFRANVKFRNWLIIETFMQTGMRLSELLRVCSSDLYKLGSNYYIRVSDSNQTDSRARRPSLKNSYSKRTLSISEDIYFGLEHYIKNLRRPIRSGHPIKLSHGFVFVSERGSPLAKTSIAEMILSLNKRIKSRHKEFPKISPHTFRHTFAERFLSSLIDFQGYDMERAKDILRSYCGWSTDSPMPVFYTKRYISVKANRENLVRVENSKMRLSHKRL